MTGQFRKSELKDLYGTKLGFDWLILTQIVGRMPDRQNTENLACESKVLKINYTRFYCFNVTVILFFFVELSFLVLIKLVFIFFKHAIKFDLYFIGNGFCGHLDNQNMMLN